MSILDLPSAGTTTHSDTHPAHHSDDTAFSTRWVRRSTAVVTVEGELDAANLREFTEYVAGHISRSRTLIVDLRQVNFFAISCYPVMHNVNLRCVRERVDWTLLPGAATARVLRICDPQAQLPISSSLAAALSYLPESA